MNTLAAFLNTISESYLIKTVNQMVSSIDFLQKAIESQTGSATAIALTKQRKTLKKLNRLAQISCIGGVGYVKALCITEGNIDHLFDYYSPYPDMRGESHLKAFFTPSNLIPFLMQHNILEKASSITSFAKNLPDLSTEDIQIRDILNARFGLQNISFSEQLSNLLEQEYEAFNTSNPLDKRQQENIYQTVLLLAERKYPFAQILGSRLAAEKGDIKLSKSLLSDILRNKFQSNSDSSFAKEALKLSEKQDTTSLIQLYFKKKEIHSL